MMYTKLQELELHLHDAGLMSWTSWNAEIQIQNSRKLTKELMEMFGHQVLEKHLIDYLEIAHNGWDATLGTLKWKQ